MTKFPQLPLISQDTTQNTEKLEIFSVNEISNRIKWLLENKFSSLKVRGEISGIRLSSLGHCYFNLKEGMSVLATICWKNHMSKINLELKDGLEVIVKGKISSYIAQSKYQLYAETISLYGVGSFIQLINERKNKLEKEGFFDQKYKKKLKFLPKRIALITSIQGAVIQDIIHRIQDRCPLHIIVFNASVQGEGADLEICSAIKRIHSLGKNLEPDLIIIARGGGSIEDLFPFSSEELVKEVFASQIPIISAIGHQTDYSLLDFVADLRAPTPTAAAEFAVPVLKDLHYNLNSVFSKIVNVAKTSIKNWHTSLKMYNNLQKYPTSVTTNIVQKLDDILYKINKNTINALELRKKTILSISISKKTLLIIVNHKMTSLDIFISSIKKHIFQLINKLNTEITIYEKLIDNSDVQHSLKRGFAIIQDSNEKIISSVKDIKKDILIQFLDGKIEANLNTFKEVQKIEK